MSRNQAPRITRRTAARMLRGASVTVPDALAGLFAAAVAPPRDGELAGERAATEAFLAAGHRSTVPPARSRWPRRPVALKVAVAVAAICTAGGVATAAATGHLARPASGSSVSTSAHPSVSTTLRATSPPHGSSTAHHPSPSLVGQCRAYTARAANHTVPPNDPAAAALITAAGGTTDVGTYCSALLKAFAASTGAGSSAGHSAPGRSAAGHQAGADHPTGPPTTHPTGVPATHRSGAPATHSTGPPRTHPNGAASAPGRH
jgi:hypothetical protein